VAKSLKKTYLDNEVEMKLYGRIDGEGSGQMMCVSHVILNGQRYYPEELTGEVKEALVKLLRHNMMWPFQYKSP